MEVFRYLQDKTSLIITTDDYTIYQVEHIYEQAYDHETIEHITTYHDFPDVHYSEVVCKYRMVTDNHNMDYSSLAKKYSDYLKCDLLCDVFWDKKDIPPSHSDLSRFEVFCKRVGINKPTKYPNRKKSWIEAIDRMKTLYRPSEPKPTPYNGTKYLHLYARD